MNLRIAILFSGRINTNPLLYESFKIQLCQNYGYECCCDVFISHPKDTPADLIREVTELYQPKIIIENNEDYFNVDKYEKNPYTNKHNAMSMYLSRANLWREFENYVDTTGSSYDAVISTRMDLQYTSPLVFTESFVSHIKSNDLMIPEGDDHSGINDRFAVGNMASMANYMKTYHNLFHLLESGVLCHPETLLLQNLLYQTQHIDRFPFECHIIR